MYRQHTIAAVVPAYNEEKLISKTIATIPNFVDKIIVVDDGSKDNTSNIVESFRNNFSDRLILIKQEKNKGVGEAIKTGYKKSLELGVDITAVMAGDAQMDPAQLSKLLDPIIENKADYAKGNRLLSKDIDKMPKIRQKGNAILTILTKVASGYWDIMDPQNGYTATSKDVVKIVVNENIYSRYGYCNDILTKLNIYNFRVVDVVMPPRYGEEESKIRLRSYTPKISFLLLKLFFYRINKKYGGINFHPLLLFYYLGLILTSIGFLLALYILYIRILTGTYTIGTITFDALLLILGVQFLLFAMLFDEMAGRKLIHFQNNIKVNKKNFVSRMRKYLGVDFHPLILFYIGGILMLVAGGVLGGYVIYKRVTAGSQSFTSGTLLIVVLFLIMGFQSLFFGRIFELEVESGNR